jgi:ABC-type Fe3+/spermidine/putrescine transport system ATPase subunit
VVDCPEIGKIYLNHGVTGPHEASVWAAVRPEKMMLCKPGEAVGRDAPEGHNVANGTIKGMSYLGDCTLYEVMLDSGRMIRVSRANLSRFDQEDFTWDDKVSLSWHPSSPVVLLA